MLCGSAWHVTNLPELIRIFLPKCLPEDVQEPHPSEAPRHWPHFRPTESEFLWTETCESVVSASTWGILEYWILTPKVYWVLTPTALTELDSTTGEIDSLILLFSCHSAGISCCHGEVRSGEWGNSYSCITAGIRQVVVVCRGSETAQRWEHHTWDTQRCQETANESRTGGNVPLNDSHPWVKDEIRT